MTGEDKMNRIFMYIGVIVGLALGANLPVEAQKKSLDIEACTLWKRIDAPDISPTGRWVIYRISLMEYNPDNREEKPLHLFDSHTRKERLFCVVPLDTSAICASSSVSGCTSSVNSTFCLG